MFAVIQYPFIDTRLLNEECPTGSFFPQQFHRHPARSRYFRFLGPEKLRRCSEDFPEGEKNYFDSKAAVSFLPASQEPMGKGVFKRLYADGLSLHYDIGLYARLGQFFLSECRPFVRELMETPRLKVTSRFEYRECEFSLYTFFDELLRLYQYATTSKKAAGALITPTQAGILPGTPAVIISCQSFELKPASKTKWLKLLPDLRVGCSLLNLRDHPIAVYCIERNFTFSRKDEVRRLRVCISKIHAYKEALRLLMSFIEYRHTSGIKLRPLRVYLNQLLRLAEKKRYYGFDNQDFWGLAFSIDESFHQQQWIDLIDRAKNISECLEQEMKTGANVYYYNHRGVMTVGSNDVHIGNISIEE